MLNPVVIIPARSGSKGLPDKNLALLGGYPLIAYSIVAAKMCGWKRVIVSTDSEYYAWISRKFGAETPFLRPVELASDKSTDLEFFRHAINWTSENEGQVPEYWIHLRPTTPLRELSILTAAATLMESKGKATSLRSAHLAPESPFKWFLRGEAGYFQSLKDEMTSEQVGQPRQSFPDVYVPNGYIDIVRSSHVLKKDELHGNQMFIFPTPVCTEVDTREELDYLEYQLKRDGSILHNELCCTYPSMSSND